MELIDILKIAAARGASDLHLAAGRPAVARVDGLLVNMEGEPLTSAEIERMLHAVLTKDRIHKLEQTRELDFALSIPGMDRFRVNIHFQKGGIAASLRVIPALIRDFKQLGLPIRVCEWLARRPAGLVLVTGPTGSGKSTTLAAMIDLINSERACHIITIEDPIEYVHAHKQALVEQREVHQDTASFHNALKHILRQDPDVIMIGEMRDHETISTALTAAETGHLVLSTLHTADTVQTVDRIVDVFPPHQQGQIRVQLASVLEGVFSQTLMPSASGHGRELAMESLVATDAVRTLIREGKTHQICTHLEAGGSAGMNTMARAIAELLKRERISRDTAFAYARKVDELKRHMQMMI
ncbi:MAG: type IV pilus twitching motility protein PilT [Candidatus Sumerlaeota bacterium]|nr:type IV pilus twitching motility protein PilT [Candidatus Sumerlaeota bacterium]